MFAIVAQSTDMWSRNSRVETLPYTFDSKLAAEDWCVDNVNGLIREAIDPVEVIWTQAGVVLDRFTYGLTSWVIVPTTSLAVN